MALIDPILLERSAIKAFGQLTQKVNRSIMLRQNVSQRGLFASLMDLGDRFEMQGQHHIMNTKSAEFAEDLLSKKEYDLASIVYGILIKINRNNPALTEEFAKKALSVAKKTGDPIHIMARADDLNYLYRQTEYGSKKHFQALLEEKKALVEIVTNYEGAVRKYRTLTRQPLTKDRYEFMLCGIKMEIAKIKLETNPLLAINELESAQKIMRKYGQGTLVKRIKGLLDIAYSNL